MRSDHWAAAVGQRVVRSPGERMREWRRQMVARMVPLQAASPSEEAALSSESGKSGAAIYDMGGGGGAGGSLRGSGTTGEGSTTARGSPIGGGAVVLDIRDGISGVNHPVNPVPAGSFPAIPAAGGASSGCDFNGPNIAVKSPTFFRGVSIGCEDRQEWATACLREMAPEKSW